mmetsp:Transcript_21420/g.18999  ORF Transcript_21420/g.18999 Transcript_21420/m.18999 type:complete len:191 (+) Transcript_21420:110-682(+)
MAGTNLLRLSSNEKLGPNGKTNSKVFQKPTKINKLKKLQSLERKNESIDSGSGSDKLNEMEQDLKLKNYLVVDSKAIRKFKNREQSKSKDNSNKIEESRNYCFNDTKPKNIARHRRMVSLGSRSLQERRKQHKRAKSIKEIDLCSHGSREDNIPKIIHLLHSAQVSPRFDMNNQIASQLNLAEYLNKKCL